MKKPFTYVPLLTVLLYPAMLVWRLHAGCIDREYDDVTGRQVIYVWYRFEMVGLYREYKEKMPQKEQEAKQLLKIYQNGGSKKEVRYSGI